MVGTASQGTENHDKDPVFSVAVIGTDTGVGKTRVSALLVRGLRALGRRVWIHKPVACGGWAEGTAEDGRVLAGLLADGQPLASVCPFQFPEPASPHLSAAAAGVAVTLAALLANLQRVRGDDHDLVVEGVGGLLVPLTPTRQTVADLCVASRLPALVVTRPHLGTLNHTALTVVAARAAGIPLLGLVINAHQPVLPGLATDHAVRELTEICGLPVLAELPYGPEPAMETALALARAVLRLPARR